MTARKHRNITLEEVESHNTVEDFWTVIDNKVYDLSGFDHPGGVLINALSGSDGTIMYNHYHFKRGGLSDSVLAAKMIGVLAPESARSPVMGRFYCDLSQRVATALETNRSAACPSWGIVMAFVDFAVALLLTICVLSLLTPELPLGALVALTYLREEFILRLRSQAHAVGHLQLTSKRWVGAMELAMLICSETAFTYTLPSSQGPNLRKKLNRDRSISQHEFEYRGPFEHQAIHHVKGTDFYNDGCYMHASLNYFVRLRSGKIPIAMGGIGVMLQGFELGRFILVSINYCAQPLKLISIKIVNTKHLFRHGQWVRAAASAVGVVWVTVSAWTSVVAPALCSWLALPLLMLAKFLIGNFWMLFFAQHTWDQHIPQQEADADWGAAQVKGCYSLWGKNLWFHPLVWFYGGGACPSTLTYHLEHTLFPGISYLHLPGIAPVVEKACHDHGLPYNKIAGLWDLRKVFNDQLNKHSRICDSADAKFKLT
jgi:cytochrome b involved in lipid metabolism